MPRGHRSVGALLALLSLLSPAARGQEPPPDPKQVLAAARTAIQLARSFTYRARYEGTGLAQASTPGLVADVAVERMITGGPVMARLSVSGQTSTPGKPAGAAQLVFDGRKVRWPNPDGSVTVAEPGEDYEILLKRPEFAAVPAELVAEQPFTTAIEQATLSHEGRKIVEGSNCDVVLIEYPAAGGQDPARQRWSIGADDHLPRRLEIPLKVVAAEGAGQADAGLVLALSSIRRDTPIPRAKFRMVGTRDVELRAPDKTGRKPSPRQPSDKPAPRRGLLSPGAAAPEWDLKDAEGKPHTLAEHHGRVVVVDFWATWCAPCRETMPRLQALHAKYQGRPVAVVGISSGEKADPVTGPAAFMRDNKATYGLLVEGDTAAAAYGVTQLPTVYVLSAEGKVLFRSTGPGEDEFNRIENIIEAQLKRMK